jgi:hypothetical protein
VTEISSDEGAVRSIHRGVLVDEAVEIKASANGPLLVRGPIRVVDAEGNLLAELEKAALCRCGHSSNKPFCDGTHKRIGFTA